MLAGDRGQGKLKILMIDCSASMSSKEGAQTRLAIAREEAHKSIDDLRSADRGMVIAFADRARVLCAISDDKRKLHAAVNEIAQSDAAGRLTEAMQLAEAPSSDVGEVRGRESEHPFNH